MADEDAVESELSIDGSSDVTDLDELVRDYKSNRRRGMLGWFKLKVKYPVALFMIDIASISILNT